MKVIKIFRSDQIRSVAQSCPTLCDPMNRSTPGLPVHHQRILKAAREKQQVTYKGNPTCLTADLSAETLQVRREWQDIFKVLKGENLQPRLLYPAKISFKTDGEIKSFSDKQKLREFSTTTPALQQMFSRFSRSVMSDSLRTHELQHTRPPCPSPTPRVHPNSCASSWWCHPAISSSVVPFSSCPSIRVFSNV